VTNYVRNAILTALKQGALETWQIVARTGASRSSIVHALKGLKSAGLVEKRDQFKYAIYALTTEGFETLQAHREESDGDQG